MFQSQHGLAFWPDPRVLVMSSTVLLGLALFVVCVSGATYQSKPITIDLPAQGRLEGLTLLVGRSRVAVFLGIPYAAPPLENLRFAPPQSEPPVSWSGVRSATKPAPSCFQRREDLVRMDKLNIITKLYGNASYLPISEDCLYLNVYAPDGPPPRGQDSWPVLVYLHPTDFLSGSPYIIDPISFVTRNKVIVVTPAFRLNIFGFLSTGNAYSQGNFGLMDQAAAIGWVQKSISRFNGTASDVTLMGHSGGAVSVTIHMLGQSGGFHRAIALSGSVLQPGVIKTPDLKVLEEIRSVFDCNKPHAEMMICLRRAGDSYLLENGLNLGSWGPIIDALPNVTSPFLPEDPEDALLAGKFSQVPFLTGFVQSEESHSTPTDLAITKEYFANALRTSVAESNTMHLENDSRCTFDEDLLHSAVEFFYAPSRLSDSVLLRQKLVEFYTDKNYAAAIFKTAEYVSMYSATYVYRFEYKMKTVIVDRKENHVYLSHQSELPFVFGMPYWGSVTPPILWNNADRKVAEQTMLIFLNFMKYPEIETKTQPVSWARFSTEQPQILIIGREMTMADSSVIDYKSFSFWNEFYPQVQRAAYHCCNTTDLAYTTTANLALLTASSFYILFHSPSYLLDLIYT